MTNTSLPVHDTEQSSRIAPWVLLFLVVVIVFGGALRFVNLGKKYFWMDEAHTTLTVTGNSRRDIDLDALYSNPWTPQDILAEYQTVRTDRSIFDVVQNLGAQEPLNPPLYFVLTRIWVQVAGQSPATYRALSAFFSLLIIPAVYLFTRTLGWSKIAAIIATALVAVSPFQIEFAQEARVYSVSMLLMTLASATLLLALHTNKRWQWLLYTILMILGFYTNSFNVWLQISHGIYVLLIYGLQTRAPFIKLSNQIRWFILANIIIILAYLPWILKILSTNDTSSWLLGRIGLSQLLKTWVINFGKPLVDLFQLPGIMELAIVLPILLLVLYSMIYMIRHASRRSSLFVMLLILVNFVILAAIDIVIGAIFSTPSRYISLTLLAMLQPVAYLLASKISVDNPRIRQAWTVVMVAVIGLSLLSSTLMVMSPVVRGKGNDEDFIRVIQILNAQGPSTLIVNPLEDGSTFGNILGMSHRLNNDVQFRFVQDIDNFTGDTSGNLFWLHKTDVNADNDDLGSIAGGKYSVTEVVPGLLWGLTAK